MRITWCENRSRNRCAELSSTSTTETFEYPPYSRDLAPSDFHLFGLLEKHLAGLHFRTDAEVQEAVVLVDPRLGP
ncbi:hypothetical protein AVEN_224614-1 [Araneus ventricosus]|uniref:Tc1-like transposase DDE domain-containing protein n=1 Tax=Araneus ventricosus TaxID=182803 RepID=A0A4Y2NQP5_ARAVE|nr:hypothetical protein AVEN_224614-1 [Araneus ventricosus]